MRTRIPPSSCWLPAILALAALVVGACGSTGACCTQPTTPATTAPATTAPTTTAPSSAGGRKVMVIAEENHGYDQVIGNPDAPYLGRLAAAYGNVTHLDAGYPSRCPSLAAYLLMTSGTTDGICDDKPPRAHPLAGDNVFSQVAAGGRQWRAYAESAPTRCALTNHDHYLVRHVPATYYLAARADCARWAVPSGGVASGALHDDVAAGALPAFSFVTPDACDDMHGAGGCAGDLVAAGDRWLADRLPSILAAPDYRAGRLVVIITWDEGTDTDNHIPAIVISPTTHQVTAGQSVTQCSILRLIEEQLRLPLLGCANAAPSLAAILHL